MTFLLFLFTFFTVIYLMNLFIGLLNIAIENYKKHEEFLLIHHPHNEKSSSSTVKNHHLHSEKSSST